jgi:hypothetical protein
MFLMYKNRHVQNLWKLCVFHKHYIHVQLHLKDRAMDEIKSIYITAATKRNRLLHVSLLQRCIAAVR